MSAPPSSSSWGPLQGVKVVSCSTAQAGTVPWMLMADLGAGFDRGLDLRVVGHGADGWATLAESAAAVVRDGGLTEIAAGSETVLVLRSRTESVE